MGTEYTNRGFAYRNFIDNRHNECSIQESSNAMKACIWLGSNKIGLTHFKAEWGGWKDMPECDEHSMTDHYVANNRMELDQEMVRNLLPALQYFAEHGTLPE